MENNEEHRNDIDVSVPAGGWKPHAFHLNLPPHHIDQDGVPYITKFAERKSRQVVDLAHSIQLTEEMYYRKSSKGHHIPCDGEGEDEEDEDEDEDEDEEEDLSADQKTNSDSLDSLMKKCSRLHSQVSTLIRWKHGSGIGQRERCQMILHLLRLLCATRTLSYTQNDDAMDVDNQGEPKAGTSPLVKLHFDNVGYILDAGGSVAYGDQVDPVVEDSAVLEEDLSQQFALPAPARESLLSVLVDLLSKKGPLRSVSNSALFLEKDGGGESAKDRFLMIIHWRALLRLLLRTAPYLNEFKTGYPPDAPSSRLNSFIKRTVHLIRECRRFFDQGTRPPGCAPARIDATARDLWEMTKTDLLVHTHSLACFRAQIMLYLFHPSKCSPEFYQEVMPSWIKSWCSVDRCPDFDSLWLVLFCRARKYLSSKSYDWGPIRRRLLTLASFWLQIPSGGSSADKSFPRVAMPRTRGFPSLLKVFVGTSSSYEEGMDFVAKVCKLLVHNLGCNDLDQGKIVEDDTMSQGTEDVLRFFHFVSPYFNPSNTGSWTFGLGAFLHNFAFELCRKIGVSASADKISETYPKLSEQLIISEPSLESVHIPEREVVLILDVLVPLCQQALYSKNSYVGRAGESAMACLTQIDPVRVTPVFFDFTANALDISSVNLSHQAPAALSALSRLIQPGLSRRPAIFLERLPDILRLTLAGVDSNDQNKTIRTLIFYRSLSSWLSVGDRVPTSPVDEETVTFGSGTFAVGSNLVESLSRMTKSPKYIEAIANLPESSLLRRHSTTDVDSDDRVAMLAEEVEFAMSDWSLEFLERMYGLFRAAGEQEKVGKSSTGVASHHSSADVQQARNFFRVEKECMHQVFASMGDQTYQSALRSVVNFLTNETLTYGLKDVSYLCQAVAAARECHGARNNESPGLRALVPILTNDLDNCSKKTSKYRLRSLSGAVREAGADVLRYQREIVSALEHAFASDDKFLYKVGCKLLRHTLSSQCEAYPLCTGYRLSDAAKFGEPSRLRKQQVPWHVPQADQLDFVASLLTKFVIPAIEEVKNALSLDTSKTEISKEELRLAQWKLRRALRIIRYTLRGSSGLLLDYDEPCDGDDNKIDYRDLIPHEQAILSLYSAAASETRKLLQRMRSNISIVVGAAMEHVSSFPPESSGASADCVSTSIIHSDAKVCTELNDISSLLITGRGLMSKGTKSIWLAQKQYSSDHAVASVSDHMATALYRSSYFSSHNMGLYKDGEDGGKTLHRRLIVTRVRLFHESIQRNATFEVPRRLKRQRDKRNKGFKNEFLLSANRFERLLSNPSKHVHALDLYDGVIDGLFAMCCHTNANVRASASSSIDDGFSRFGWTAKNRFPRLLNAILLQDNKQDLKFGLPSCALLVNKVNAQGKRKRLAEVIKGVCTITATHRIMKQAMSSESSRFKLVRALCGTESLIALMPAEEMQKIVHYFHMIFTKFRSNYYARTTFHDDEVAAYRSCIEYLINLLDSGEQPSSKPPTKNAAGESPLESDGKEKQELSSMHWRNRLVSGWFLTTMISSQELASNPGLLSILWETCFALLRQEKGQPLQRVALGLFGRLLFLTRNDNCQIPGNASALAAESLRNRFQDKDFCAVFTDALVFDHKEDSSVGGGHDAQWSAGVEEMLRDASSNVAPRVFFPFQRIAKNTGHVKVSHSLLVESVILNLGEDSSDIVSAHLLAFATELALAPPSEDQRNQLCTSAELFSGVCSAMLSINSELEKLWTGLLLPFLDAVIPKIPFNMIGTFFDAIRYGVHRCRANQSLPLLNWLIEKIVLTLWQEMELQGNGNEIADNTESTSAEGFAGQSKWLYLTSAVLIELNNEGDMDTNTAWYAIALKASVAALHVASSEMERSWAAISEKLLPRVLNALGHPFENCRDDVAGLLFRICYSYRKMINSLELSSGAAGSVLSDPTECILKKMKSSFVLDSNASKKYYRAMITSRKFLTYSLHFGDGTHEQVRHIVPLLSELFQALRVTDEDPDAKTEDASKEAIAKRALEADVVKGFRYTLSEVANSFIVAYGNSDDISAVLDVVTSAAKNDSWQVRRAATHVIRCFQGSHKFVFDARQAEQATKMIIGLLGDERREVSLAALSALTGILAVTSGKEVECLVDKYVPIANRSVIKKSKKKAATKIVINDGVTDEALLKEREESRARKQQTSVFFLCAVVLAHPYDTPKFVPKALAALSKHSFERSAPLGVREAVKKCCSEYKRTHMSENWEVHKRQFTQEQLEAFNDVVSTPHYYA